MNTPAPGWVWASQAGLFREGWGGEACDLRIASCHVQSDVERLLAHTCLTRPCKWLQLNIQGFCLPRPVFCSSFFFSRLLSYVDNGRWDLEEIRDLWKNKLYQKRKNNSFHSPVTWLICRCLKILYLSSIPGSREWGEKKRKKLSFI